MPPKVTKSSPSEDDAPLTMTLFSQLLEQQKEFYREMLQQQQDNFKGFVQMLIESTNKRLDDVIRDLQGVKTSLEFTQANVDVMSKDYKEMEIKLKQFENDIKKSKEDLDNLPTLACLEKLDYLDNQCRRNNILVDGIPEVKGESWSESESKVRNVLVEKLGLDAKIIEFERAHRIGQYHDGGRPRQIVVKFLRFKDKQAVLSSARKLKGTNIFINEDFSEAVQKKRRELLPELKAARGRGEKASLKYDKLIIKSKNESLQ